MAEPLSDEDLAAIECDALRALSALALADEPAAEAVVNQTLRLVADLRAARAALATERAAGRAGEREACAAIALSTAQCDAGMAIKQTPGSLAEATYTAAANAAAEIHSEIEARSSTTPDGQGGGGGA